MMPAKTLTRFCRHPGCAQCVRADSRTGYCYVHFHHHMRDADYRAPPAAAASGPEKADMRLKKVSIATSTPVNGLTSVEVSLPRAPWE
jgi:hypothetical protein